MSRKQKEAGATARLLTPPGSGGIAVIEVRGDGAGAAVARIFRATSGCDWLAGAPGQLHYGHIREGDAVVDEVIVRRGGGGTVEINGHGGIVAAGEILRLLGEGGVAELAPGAFATPSSGVALDAIQQEAAAGLPQAETRLAVRVLCDQLNGALSEAIRAIAAGPADAAERLGALLESAAFGRALNCPRRVVLVGRPNVGKSTLFNALVGHNRTITSPVPGTTRDFVEEFVALGGYPVQLIDTAGLRRRGDVVEMKGVQAAWRVLSDADLTIVVVDGSEPMTGEERRTVESLLPGASVLAVNKSDLPPALDPESLRPGVEPCWVSALSGEGLRELERAILRRFPDPGCYPPGAPVVFSDRQTQALSGAMRRYASGEDPRPELLRLLA